MDLTANFCPSSVEFIICSFYHVPEVNGGLPLTVDTGSVSKRMSELFLTSVLIKMKENQGKSSQYMSLFGNI